ncbi:hypothetical protein J3R83DRAFT_11054 [Lanmaoa asiatica]|nr:hypothetical protein J3R83DRAFT_11054 [Lanmaoa asiatica]
MEWEVLQDLEVILEVPLLAQKTMCGEETPLLGGAVPAFEVFIAQWKRLSDLVDAPHLRVFMSEGLERAEHYYNCLGRSKAYLFAMCKSFLLIHASVSPGWRDTGTLK